MGDAFAGLLAIGVVALCIAAWVTHVIACIAANTASAVALLIIGLAIPPVGVVHGIAVWFGYSWVAGV